MFDKLGLKKAIFDYKNNVYKKLDFTKSQIKSDLKNIFTKFHVDASNIFTFNIDGNSESSVSTYLDSLTNTIYKKQLAKKQKDTETQKDNKDTSSQANKNDEANKSSNKKQLLISGKELKSWTDSEIKPNLIKKHLQAGFTQEELNKHDSEPIILETEGKEIDLKIPEGTYIDRHVEAYKKIREYVLEQEKKQDEKNPEFVEGQYANESNENNEKDDNFGKLQEDESELSDQEPVQDEDTLEEDALTEEDLDDIAKYGIDGMSTHSDMVAFKESEEWEMIQKMQSNALSKYDNE